MEKDIARLRGPVFTEQYNVLVEPELKQKILALKSLGVDMPEEVRRAIRSLVERLDRQVNRK
jgi:hypothetical protein